MKIEPALPRRLTLVRRLARVLVIALTLVFFFGAIIVPFEIDHPEAKIHNFFDGIWWASTTMTTVGYGDMVPVTEGGKVLAIILQLVGASIFFGAVVGTITVYLHHTIDDYRWKRLHEKLEWMEKETKTLHSKIDYLVKNKPNQPTKPRQWGL